MIFEGSRYTNSKKAIMKIKNQNKRPLVFNPHKLSIDDLGKDFFVYITKNGDELDALSERFGGEGKFEEWWKLAQINNITYPLEIGSGTKLIVPRKQLFSNIKKLTLPGI